MSDPEIIKSSSPHKVSIPEGSSNAVGKKAEVGESSIRKVLNDASGETNEITKNEDELKGEKTPLSLDYEIALAREALKNKKNLRVGNEAVQTNDDLRAGKAGVTNDQDLRAEKAPISLDDMLKGGKEGFSPSKDLTAGKAGVEPAGDLRAEKLGVDPSSDLRGEKAGYEPSDDLRAEKEDAQATNNLRVPKEGLDPDGDLKAPKEAISASKDLRAPNENENADADLRAPKEGVKTNSATALVSSDPLASVRPATSTEESAASDTSKEAAPQQATALSNEYASVANNTPPQKPEPEMDFPARVVHLKIENDNLRTALDKLEAAP
jgi:hypothetical protein